MRCPQRRHLPTLFLEMWKIHGRYPHYKLPRNCWVVLSQPCVSAWARQRAGDAVLADIHGAR